METGDKAWLFYDGNCGLCHRAVKFVLRHDPQGRHFVFAPLDSPAFRRRVPQHRAAILPDSVVVLTSSGEFLVESTAVVYLLRKLGGRWSLAGFLLQVIPQGLRDASYRGVARVRRKLFARPEAACPLMSAELRARFHID
ncbi:MAG TPA: DCC1-like thiol-disulfide oxidoreductase family protein [Bryobacteraceae bacterium]|nr:DCC1-like thiol-disulfide oxidoreductase family protein [Bryobacteraceae bacterium]